MTAALRHLASILILPFVVVAVMPRWLLTSLAEWDHRWQAVPLIFGGRTLGLVVFVLGFLVFGWCVVLFGRVGGGTLAPWDPTQRLVAVGPYRHVRNPMISAVAVMLAGEALFFGSLVLAAWFLVFIIINHIYFRVSEEPGLERRFGRSYADYRSRVPRWLPRIRL